MDFYNFFVNTTFISNRAESAGICIWIKLPFVIHGNYRSQISFGLTSKAFGGVQVEGIITGNILLSFTAETSKWAKKAISFTGIEILKVL